MINWKMKIRIMKVGLFLFAMFFVFGIINYVYINADRELTKVADKLVRLHVIANSDSIEDQDLKRKVRDEVILQMSPKFEGLRNVNQVKQVISDNIKLIENIAAQVAAENQKNYGAKALIGNFNFPTRMYSNLTLPAGNYQALKIVLGNGEGQNWWCIMFPPLCFIDIAHGVVPEQTMEQLKKNLDEGEYKLLTATRTDVDVPYKLKFRLVEIAKSMNIRIAKVGELFKF